MGRTFTNKYNWDDFDNTWGLSAFQKYRIRKHFKQEAKVIMQNLINESVNDKQRRRTDLNAHIDPDDPFKLDLGGEG
tara:strand:- start:10626 stop:10856 length:231 start_codon:yes stop_codon:yes gene_type:complete